MPGPDSIVPIRITLDATEVTVNVLPSMKPVRKNSGGGTAARFSCPGATVEAGLAEWPGAWDAAEFPLPDWPGAPTAALVGGAMPVAGPTALNGDAVWLYADDAHTTTTTIAFTYPVLFMITAPIPRVLCGLTHSET